MVTKIQKWGIRHPIVKIGWQIRSKPRTTALRAMAKSRRALCRSLGFLRILSPSLVISLSIL